MHTHTGPYRATYTYRGQGPCNGLPYRVAYQDGDQIVAVSIACNWSWAGNIVQFLREFSLE